AQAGAADQQGTINLAGGDLLRRLDRDDRVAGAVLAPGDADGDDLVDAGVVLQQLLPRALVAVSGVVRSGDDRPAPSGRLRGGASPLPSARWERVCSWDGARRPLGAERALPARAQPTSCSPSRVTIRAHEITPGSGMPT